MGSAFGRLRPCSQEAGTGGAFVIEGRVCFKAHVVTELGTAGK